MKLLWGGGKKSVSGAGGKAHLNIMKKRKVFSVPFGGEQKKTRSFAY